MNSPMPRPAITAVILAGGEGRRMGGRDKGWVEVEGRPLIAHVLAHLAPQVGAILISANREHARYAALGHPVISDETPGFHGPLAGIVTALAHVATPWLVTVPVDARAPAPDLVERLWQGAIARKARIAVANDGEREQPLFAIYAQSVSREVGQCFASGERQVRAMQRQLGAVSVDFRDRAASFSNLNALGDTAGPVT